MNRLQALDEPVDYCVTLNQARPDLRRRRELGRMVYEHPVYTLDALEAQRLLPALSGRRNTAFCGAYHGWGFHEDGCVSGIRAALALGCALVSGAALYAGQVDARPRRPVRAPCSATACTCGWSTSTDRPRLPPGARPLGSHPQPRPPGRPRRAASARTWTPSWRCTASTWAAAGC